MFCQAYKLTQDPRVLPNISLAYESRAQYVEALAALLECPEPRTPKISLLINRLRTKIGTIIVTPIVPGLDVQTDPGRPPAVRANPELCVSGNQPATQDSTEWCVSIGQHHVTLTAPNFVSREVVFQVAGGTTQTLNGTLQPIPSSTAVEAKPVHTPPRRIIQVRGLQTAGLITTGFGAVSLAAGAVLFLVNNGRLEHDSHIVDMYMDPHAKANLQWEQGYQVLAIAGMGGGLLGTLIGLGIVLWPIAINHGDQVLSFRICTALHEFFIEGSF